jgi:hypothetical protein
LRAEITGQSDKKGSWGRPPFFVESRSGGRAAQLNRQCTSEYKIDPLRKKQRELLGYLPRQKIPPKSIEIWIGISTDEIQRMKDSRDKWQVNRWPLIEKRMNRWDCLRWLDRHGYPKPPKSACTFCPFRDNKSWREMRDNDPESWADAVQVDREIRDGMPGVDSQVFVHRSMKPLDQVDLRTAADKGQIEFGFIQECEGMCGV